MVISDILGDGTRINETCWTERRRAVLGTGALDRPTALRLGVWQATQKPRRGPLPIDANTERGHTTTPAAMAVLLEID